MGIVFRLVRSIVNPAQVDQFKLDVFSVADWQAIAPEAGKDYSDVILASIFVCFFNQFGASKLKLFDI